MEQRFHRKQLTSLLTTQTMFYGYLGLIYGHYLFQPGFHTFKLSYHLNILDILELRIRVLKNFDPDSCYVPGSKSL